MWGAQTGPGVHSVQATGLPNGGDYQLDVQACTAAGSNCTGLGTAIRDFYVDVYPSAPTNASPAAGATVSDANPVLQVTGGNDTDGQAPSRWLFQVADNAQMGGEDSCAFEHSAPTIGLQQITTACGSRLVQNGRTLYWRALVRNDVFWSNFSNVTSFVWAGVPTVPTLHSPKGAASVPTTTPVLTVVSGPIADDQASIGFTFQVARDQQFTQDLRESTIATLNPSFAVPADWLRNDTTYYWRARATNPYGTSDWSPPFSFSTKLLHLGTDGPMWSGGSLGVNLKTGNLTAALPGPSYAAAVGSMGFGLSYNSRQPKDEGFGPGLEMTLGAEIGDVPTKLIDHEVRAVDDPLRMNAIEVVYGDGDSQFFVPQGDRLSYEPAGGGGGSLLTRYADETGEGFTLDEAGDVFVFGKPQDGVSLITRAESSAGATQAGALRYAFTQSSPARPSRITDPAGRELTLQWAGTGCAAILCATGPDGRTWRYVGDGSGGTSGRLITVNDGARDVLALTWNTAGRLASVRNANDLAPASASPGYDPAHKLQISYDADSRVTSIEDGPIGGQSPASSTTTFGYSPGPVGITATRAIHPGAPAGTVRSADGFGEVTPPRQQGQASPKRARTYYDDMGRAIEERDLAGRVTSSGYNPDGTLAWTEDSSGRPQDFTNDPLEKVVTETAGIDPDGSGSQPRPVTRTRYDERAVGTGQAPGPRLSGLRGDYFPNPNLAGRPALVRTDSQIDFNWGTSAPAAGLPSDNFSVRWTGSIDVPAAAQYVFTTTADDGVRLAIDGQLVINRWNVPQDRESEPVALTAGRHRIELSYREFGGSATARLQWRTVGGSNAIVASSALAPAYMNATSTVSPGGRVGFTHYAVPDSRLSDYSLVTSGPDRMVTSFTHDALGRVVSKTMPEGNAARAIDPQSGALGGTPDAAYTTTWSYYALPPVSATPDPAQAAEDPAVSACAIGGGTVNQAGLLKRKAVAGMANEDFVYDAPGRSRAEIRGRGTTCRTFGTDGRVLTETTGAGTAAAETTTTTYDPSGQVRTVSAPGKGTVTTEYDEAGRAVRTLDSLGTAPPPPPGTATDSTPPTIAMLSPPPNAAVSGTGVSVAAAAGDDVSIAGVQFTLDGQPLGPEDTRPPFRVVWDSTEATDGPHTLGAIARDGSGKTTTSTGLSVTVTGGVAVPPPPPAGLVAAYGFDEGGGTTVADASGTGNAGAVSGASWTSAGKNAGALSFDGIDDQVTVADSASLDLTTGMTASAWVYPTVTDSSFRTVLAKETGGSMAYGIYASGSHTNNPPGGYVHTSQLYGQRSTSALPVNTWTHLATTYDGTNLRFYVNGQLAGSRVISGGMLTSTNPLRIGNNAVWSGEAFAGRIDDVRVYDRALSATEIAADRDAAVAPAAPSPGAGVASIPGNDGATEVRWTYDSEGGVLTRHAAPGAISAGQSHWICAEYDSEGKQTALSGPHTGTPTATCPAAGDRYGFAYDGSGRLKAIQYPGGAAFSWRDYDEAGRLVHLYNRHGQLPGTLPAAAPADSEGSPIADYSYQHDLEGRRTTETLAFDASSVQVRGFGYDGVGRLATYTAPDGSVRSYSYDLDSNRTKVELTPAGGGTAQTLATYTYAATGTDNDGVDQLVKVTEGGTTTRFHYTPDGDLAERRNDATNALMATMTWDGSGLSTGGTFAGTQVVTTLGPRGEAKARGSNGRTLEYLGAGSTLFERRGGAVTRTILDGPEPLADFTGPAPSGAKTYLFHNGHGDRAATTDSQGARQGGPLTSDPFGVPEQALPQDTTTERFTGKWLKRLDTTSGLIQMGVRPYDPALGRFLAIDPVEGGSANGYDYANAEPVNQFDLTGRCAVRRTFLSFFCPATPTNRHSPARILAGRLGGQLQTRGTPAARGCLTALGVAEVSIGITGAVREISSYLRSPDAAADRKAGTVMKGVQRAIAKGMLRSVPYGSLGVCAGGAGLGFIGW